MCLSIASSLAASSCLTSQAHSSACRKPCWQDTEHTRAHTHTHTHTHTCTNQLLGLRLHKVNSVCQLVKTRSLSIQLLGVIGKRSFDKIVIFAKNDLYQLVL